MVSLRDVSIYQDVNTVLSSVNFDIDKGEFVYHPAPNLPDIAVELSDGRTVHLFELMRAVIDRWKEFLAGEGIPLSD